MDANKFMKEQIKEKSKKRCYISGAITGVQNYELGFLMAESLLWDLGYMPVNPCNLPHNHGKTYAEYMKEDLKALLNCDCIFMLDNWEGSKGARFEKETAEICGIEVLLVNA